GGAGPGTAAHPGYDLLRFRFAAAEPLCTEPPACVPRRPPAIAEAISEAELQLGLGQPGTQVVRRIEARITVELPGACVVHEAGAGGERRLEECTTASSVQGVARVEVELAGQLSHVAHEQHQV